MTFRISIVLAALAVAAVAVKNDGVQGAVLPTADTALLENYVNVAMVGGDVNEAAELPKSDEPEQLLPLQDSLSGRGVMELNSDAEREFSSVPPKERPSWDLSDSKHCYDPNPITDYWVLQKDNGQCWAGEVLRAHPQLPSAKCCEHACNGAPFSQDLDGAALGQYTDHTCFLYNPEMDNRHPNCYCLKNCVEGTGRGGGAAECYVTERKLTQCTDGPLEKPWVVREKSSCQGGKWLGTNYSREVITSAKCCEEFCHQIHPATTCFTFATLVPRTYCHCWNGCDRTSRQANMLCASNNGFNGANDTTFYQP